MYLVHIVITGLGRLKWFRLICIQKNLGSILGRYTVLTEYFLFTSVALPKPA
jgi:hypothetical protein